MWAYFTLKLGWLKTNSRTNMGSQNNMHLSAHVIRPSKSDCGGAIQLTLSLVTLHYCTFHLSLTTLD